MKSSAFISLGLATLVLGTQHESKFQSTGFVTTKDSTQIFYKDWGNSSGQPIVFSHGWPLNSDSWDNQMFFLGQHGYRTIAHDRRGHGRSSQPWEGNDMDTYADDLLVLFEHLNLTNAVMVGHSTGGGEVMRFLGRHGTSRVSKAVLVDAVPPVLVQKPSNPGGIPLAFFDEFRANYTKNRAQFFLDFASGPFFGYNLPGAVSSPGVIQDWMQQGLRSGFVSAYECIKAFSETDFTNDMKSLNIPVLLLHGELDQIVPLKDSVLEGIKILKKGSLKIYPGGAHGLPQTAAEEVNQDLLAFITK